VCSLDAEDLVRDLLHVVLLAVARYPETVRLPYSRNDRSVKE
jgi:hypothetical protein